MNSICVLRIWQPFPGRTSADPFIIGLPMYQRLKYSSD